MKWAKRSPAQRGVRGCSCFLNWVGTVFRFVLGNTWPKLAILGLSMVGLTYVVVTACTGIVATAGVIGGLASLLLSTEMCFLIFPCHKLAVLLTVSLAVALGFIAWAQVCHIGLWINDSPTFFTAPRQVELQFESPPKWSIRSVSPAGNYSFLSTTAATGVFLVARDDYLMPEDTDRAEDAPLASISSVAAIYRLPYAEGGSPLEGVCLSQLSEWRGRSVLLRTESEGSHEEGQLELPVDGEAAMAEASEVLGPGREYSIQILSQNALIMFISLFHLNGEVFPVYELPWLDLVVEGGVNTLCFENDAYWYRQAESPIKTCSEFGTHHYDEVSTLHFTAPSTLNVNSMSNVTTYALLIAADIEIREDASRVIGYSSPVALLLQLEGSSVDLRWRVDASLLWQDPHDTALRVRRGDYGDSPGGEVVYLVSLESGGGSFVLDGTRFEVEAIDDIQLLADTVEFRRIPDAYHIAARCYDLELNGADLIPNSYWQAIPPAIQTIITGAVITLFGALLALAVRGVHLNAASKSTSRQ
jgi:hypothetical protein